MIQIDKNICKPEGRCPLTRKCPSLAISMGADGYPFIRQERCIRCQTCVRGCPENAVKIYAE